MLKKVSLVAASMFLCASFASAETVKPTPGWGTSDDFDKAMEFAKKTGKPVAILYALQDSTCPIHNGAVESVYMDRSVANMVKVVLYVGNDKINAIQSQVASQQTVPQVFLLDPQGRVTADVSPSKEDNLKTEAAKVSQLATWEATSAKQIEKCDKDAAAGRFKNALKALAKIEDQDRQVSSAITPGASADKAEKKEAVKKSDALATKDSAEAKPSGRYFPDLLQTKRTAYEAMAAEKLKLAKEKFDAKDVGGGRKLISAMVTDGSDLDSVKEAATLMKESVASAK